MLCLRLQPQLCAGDDVSRPLVSRQTRSRRMICGFGEGSSSSDTSPTGYHGHALDGLSRSQASAYFISKGSYVLLIRVRKTAARSTLCGSWVVTAVVAWIVG